jgi:hypothetical protein
VHRAIVEQGRSAPLFCVPLIAVGGPRVLDHQRADQNAGSERVGDTEAAMR